MVYTCSAGVLYLIIEDTKVISKNKLNKFNLEKINVVVRVNQEQEYSS